MSNIYALHEKAFNRVSAYVVLHKGERVATVAFKFPADGAGRLYAYVHWIGVPMVRGFAGGYGYDKRSAAVADAAKRITDDISGRTMRTEFVQAIEKDGGSYWDRKLEDAGFTVVQAV